MERKFLATLALALSTIMPLTPTLAAGPDTKTISETLTHSNTNEVLSRAEGAEAKDTSRQRNFTWANPQHLPSPGGAAFSTRVSNLKLSILEQTTGVNNISTSYIASGTMFNLTEDDKNRTSSRWVIVLYNNIGNALDTYTFYLSRDHCSYNGEEPFQAPTFNSSNNYIDVIDHATIQGFYSARYEGGC